MLIFQQNMTYLGLFISFNYLNEIILLQNFLLNNGLAK